MLENLKRIIESKYFETIVVIIIATIIYRIIKKLVNKHLKVTNMNARQETYVRLLNNTLRYAFFILLILFILQINGVNVSSIITGVGIASAIIGLALQDFLKDIIMGMNIISEKFFMVGDVIKYKDTEGKVISIGLRNTKIQDIYNGNIISITNRNIDQVVNVSKRLFVDIPAPYEEDIEKLENILMQAVDKIKEFEFVDDCKYIGVSDFAPSSIVYKLEVDCETEYKSLIYRQTLRCVKLVFDENNIGIPYQQIDVHSK